MYTEYFQWRPTHNSNSEQRSVMAGQTLRGSLVYHSLSDSYVLSQTVVETGATSTQTVKCQEGKTFVVPYVVYEKTFPCSSYPPDGVVTWMSRSSVYWPSHVRPIQCFDVTPASASLRLSWLTM